MYIAAMCIHRNTVRAALRASNLSRPHNIKPSSDQPRRPRRRADAEPSGARARPHRLRSYKNCPKPSQSTDLSLHLLHALPIAKLVGSIASSRHQLPAPSMRALSVGEDSAAGALEGGPIAHDTLIWTAHRACGQLEFSRHAHCSHPREPSSPCGLLFASAQRPRTRSLASARWRRAASSAVADPGALPA